MVSRLAEAIRLPIDAPRLDGFPSFQVEALTKHGVVNKVTDVLRWMTEVADASGGDVS